MKFYATAIFLAGAIALPAAHAAEPAAQNPALRDGQHDFDFNIGTWKTTIHRATHPLSASHEEIELTGTVTVRKVWGGRAQLEEIEADGPNGHWEGLTLFLYNPKAAQWGQYFVSSADGTFSGGTIGEFHNGRGDLYAQDTFNGRSILVRGTWSDIAADSHSYQESYSTDGGKTWDAVFTAHLTRVSP